MSAFFYIYINISILFLEQPILDTEETLSSDLQQIVEISAESDSGEPTQDHNTGNIFINNCK